MTKGYIFAKEKRHYKPKWHMELAEKPEKISLKKFGELQKKQGMVFFHDKSENAYFARVINSDKVYEIDISKEEKVNVAKEEKEAEGE